MLQPGSELQGRYQIVRLLGRGGMGAVYEARDLRLETTVAVKDCRFDEPELVRQFEREARLLARLRHPAVTRVIDHFAEGEANYLVMEFIPGDDLSAMMSKGAHFSPEQVLTWTDQLLDALDYLHSQQHPVIHRDIKPANLKLMPHGQIILLDFGLAKGSTGHTTLQTGPKSVFGYTPNYAPLEQIHGTEGTDARSDLYSLAATMYHLLTGVMPPGTLIRLSKTSDGAPDPLQPLHELNNGISPAVSQVFSRALSISRERRPASAREMRSLLRDAAAGKQLPAPPAAAPTQVAVSQPPPAAVLSGPSNVSAVPPPKKRSGAILLLVLLIGALAVAIGSAVVFGIKRLNSREPEPAVASQRPAPVSAPSSGTLRSVRSRLSSANERLAAGSSATLRGHTSTIRNLAFSPIESILASAAWDGTVRLWDVDTRREVRTIRRAVEMTSVAFSPDGKVLLIGGYGPSGSVIEFLDPKTGAAVKEQLEDRSNLISDAVITSDGRVVAALGSTIRVWNLATRQNLAEPAGTVNASVAVSSDGSLTAIGGTNENLIRIFDRDARLVRELAGHEAGILSLAFSPDGASLASGSYDSTVRIWPVDGKGPPRILKVERLDKPFSVSYSPDGSILAAGLESSLRLWNMPAGAERTTVNTAAIGFSLAWSADGKTLALGTSSGEIKLFNF